MEHTTEMEVILKSLNKEKKELSDKIAEIDKVIKRLKYGNLNLGLNKVDSQQQDFISNAQTQDPQAFPIKADLKVQAIKIMDMLGVASKLSDIRDKYHEITGQM